MACRRPSVAGGIGRPDAERVLTLRECGEAVRRNARRKRPGVELAGEGTAGLVCREGEPWRCVVARVVRLSGERRRRRSGVDRPRVARLRARIAGWVDRLDCERVQAVGNTGVDLRRDARSEGRGVQPAGEGAAGLTRREGEARRVVVAHGSRLLRDFGRRCRSVDRPAVVRLGARVSRPVRGLDGKGVRALWNVGVLRRGGTSCKGSTVEPTAKRAATLVGREREARGGVVARVTRLARDRRRRRDAVDRPRVGLLRTRVACRIRRLDDEGVQPVGEPGIAGRRCARRKRGAVELAEEAAAGLARREGEARGLDVARVTRLAGDRGGRRDGVDHPGVARLDPKIPGRVGGANREGMRTVAKSRCRS